MTTAPEYAAMLHQAVPEVPYDAFLSWVYQEGVDPARNNPLGITPPGGVAGYPSPQAGVDATAALIRSSYPQIVSAGKAGTSVEDLLRVIGQSAWNINHYSSGCGYPGCTLVEVYTSRVKPSTGSGGGSSIPILTGAEHAAGAAGNAAGNVVQIVTDPAGAASSAVGGALGGIVGGVETFLGALFKRALFVVLGLLIVVVGIVMVLYADNPVSKGLEDIAGSEEDVATAEQSKGAAHA